MKLSLLSILTPRKLTLSSLQEERWVEGLGGRRAKVAIFFKSENCLIIALFTYRLSFMCLTISLPVSIFETCNVVLTFESVDEILWCDHSNETSSAVLLHGTICFSIFYKMKVSTFTMYLNFRVLCHSLECNGQVDSYLDSSTHTKKGS